MGIAPPTWSDIGDKAKATITPAERALMGAETSDALDQQVDYFAALAELGGKKHQDALGANLQATLNRPEVQQVRATIAETKSNEAINIAVTTATSTTTEANAFKSLNETQRETARGRLAETRASSFVTGTTDFPTFKTALDADVGAGLISQETADKTISAIQKEITNTVTDLKTQHEQGLISDTELLVRVGGISNPTIKDAVSKQLSEIVKPLGKNKTAEDVLTGTTTYTTAISGITDPVEKKAVTDAIDAKILPKAELLREELRSGRKTVVQVRAEILASPSGYEQDRLDNLLQAELSGQKLADQVEGMTDLSFAVDATGRANYDALKTELNNIINSPDFNKLPPAVHKAFKEAADHQINRLDGVATLSQLKQAEFEATAEVKRLEIRRKTWERNWANYRRYLIPAGIVLAIGSGAGIFVGAGGATLGTAVLTGITTGGLAAATMGVGAGVLEGAGFTPESSVKIANMNKELQKLEVESQNAYLGVHDLQAERDALPLEALAEVARLAAEASWVVNGRNSGMTKEKYIEAFTKQSNLAEMANLRSSLSQMSLTPGPLPAGSQSSTNQTQS